MVKDRRLPPTDIECVDREERETFDSLIRFGDSRILKGLWKFKVGIARTPDPDKALSPPQKTRTCHLRNFYLKSKYLEIYLLRGQNSEPRR